MSDEQQIRAIIADYFTGLHNGDAAQLAHLFHADCVLKAPQQRRSLQCWLTHVSQRPVPASAGHPWQYRILWLQIDGLQAMAKLDCPLPHGHFIDYLGLLLEQGRWLIVNKMYSVKVDKPCKT